MTFFRGVHRRRTPIGLDIGETGVRAAQLTRTGDFYTISSLAQSVGSAPRTMEWGPHSGPYGSGFRGRYAVAALNLPDVEYHTLDLPKAAFKPGNAEADQMVRWEIERLMTEPPEGVETRYWTLPPTTAPGPNVIGVAARREVIDRAIARVEQAGLTCSCLDTVATALSRFGRLLHSWPKEKVWGVLDVGDRETRLVLCVEGVPVLVRAAGAGGGAWTQRIADALQVSTKAAEVHKRQHGVAETGGAGRPSTSCSLLGRPQPAARSELASMLLGALRSDLNDLASEIKRSYEYVLSCYPGRQAGDLVLVGGGAALRNLPEFLKNALGISVRRASEYVEDGFAACNVACRYRLPSGLHVALDLFAVALGLAVDEEDLHGDGAARCNRNLIPERVQLAQAQRRHLKRWSVALVGCAALIAVPLGMEWVGRSRLAELRVRNAQRQADLVSARTELRSVTTAADEAFLHLQRAKALRSKRAWSGMLTLMANCLPTECWLVSLATDPEVPPTAEAMGHPVQKTPTAPRRGTPGQETEKERDKVVTIEAPRKLRITGFAPDAAQPLAFVTRLKETQAFRQVTLERSLREPGQAVAPRSGESYFRFELVCEW